MEAVRETVLSWCDDGGSELARRVMTRVVGVDWAVEPKNRARTASIVA